jgi:hypothetical protein
LTGDYGIQITSNELSWKEIGKFLFCPRERTEKSVVEDFVAGKWGGFHLIAWIFLKDI